MTTQDIYQYHKKKEKRHSLYEETVKYATRNAVHIMGKYPEEMIKERRPGESKRIQKYREKIFAEVTMVPCDKVSNSLMKIRKSPDWMIKHPVEQPSVIKEGESLADYMDVNFGSYTSFTNYFFSSVFQKYLVDANAVLLWLPTNLDKSENEYYTPMPEIFSSEQIYDYSPKQWYVLKSTETVKYQDSSGGWREGAVYYYVDTTVVIRYEQINAREQFKEAWIFDHKLGVCPVVGLYGRVYDHAGKIPIYKSRISTMMPELDEALREYQDLQAEVVQHIHSTMWAYNSQKCTACKGAGSIAQAEGAPLQCQMCGGKSYIPFDPFETLILQETEVGQNSAPIPPIGYVDKKIDIAKLQDQRVQDHQYRALAAVNMEFLAVVPLTQSGVAKEWDRSELNNFVYSVAEDVVRIFDDSYLINAGYRYLGLIGEKYKELVPFIPVPQKFDIVSESVLAQDIKGMKEAGMDPLILNAAIKEFVNKKFYTDETTRLMIQAAMDINPFSSVSDDVLTQRLGNDGISKEDYTVACNIKEYIERAVDADKDFLGKPLEDQKKIIYSYAAKDSNDNTAAEEIKLKQIESAKNQKPD